MSLIPPKRMKTKTQEETSEKEKGGGGIEKSVTLTPNAERLPRYIDLREKKFTNTGGALLVATRLYQRKLVLKAASS